MILPQDPAEFVQNLELSKSGHSLGGNCGVKEKRKFTEAVSEARDFIRRHADELNSSDSHSGSLVFQLALNDGERCPSLRKQALKVRVTRFCANTTKSSEKVY